jgi:hypothetical protein
MLAELRVDNVALTERLRQVHAVADEHRDIATASLIENWIDETEPLGSCSNLVDGGATISFEMAHRRSSAHYAGSGF